MKNILAICIFLLFSNIPYKSSALDLQRHKEILKAKASVCSVGNNITVDSIANYSININGKQNLVTIKTDSLAAQTTESITNKAKDINTIEISGKGNSVSINQESKGKVEVKQRGNNNSIKISQSNHQP